MCCNVCSARETAAPPVTLVLASVIAFAVGSSARAQAVKGDPAGESPPPVLHHGLLPGLSTVDDLVAKRGKPDRAAKWYAWKMLYPSTVEGAFDSFHLQKGRQAGKIGTIEAFSIPTGCETETKIRTKLGAPEFRLEFERQALLDYSALGVRFTIDERGRTIGAAHFPHGHPRVHAGERASLSLRRDGAAGGRGSPATGDPIPRLRCGAAEADISPEGENALGPTKYVIRDPLRARAAVFVYGELAVAVVGADIFGMLKSEIDPVEERLRKRGVSHLVISMSHNHTAGDPIGIYGFYPEKYVEKIQRGIESAVLEALANARPVKELRAGSEELSLAGARVAGLFRNARNPGIVDPNVVALQAIGENDRPIATIVQFACHVEGIDSPDGGPLEVTADFPGYLCDALRGTTGAQALFLNGAVGGMVSGDTDSRTHEEAERCGRRLAGIAERILATSRPIERTLAIRRQRIEIPVTNPRMRLFMKMHEKRRPTYRGRIVSELFHLRLGSAEMVTIPGELLPELSFEILERMKGSPRMIVGLANDQLGYLIPGYDFREGAYEESMSLGPAAGPMVVRAALRLVRSASP